MMLILCRTLLQDLLFSAPGCLVQWGPELQTGTLSSFLELPGRPPGLHTEDSQAADRHPPTPKVPGSRDTGTTTSSWDPQSRAL